MNASLRIRSGAGSHEGCVRANNEDCYVCSEDQGLWVVADGMGGFEHGEWASQTLIAGLAAPLSDDGFEKARDEVAERIHSANIVIFEESERRDARMGTTVVALLIREARFAVLWAGDSRAYLLRNGDLYRLSTDHSQVQEMVDRGMLAPEDASDHPMSHVLARAVGVMEELELDIVEDAIAPGDVFLLCSDGLHGFVGEDEIARLVSQPQPDRIADALVTLTLERGAPDNVTVIAVVLTEPTAVPLASAGAIE